jgi:general secretion pathway protein G
MRKTTYGFTIVELLVVIVVIAILASITVVAYTGIQNRANDAAVRADLSNFAKTMELYKADNGTYPGESSFTTALGLKFSKNAYGTDAQGRNVRYCLNTTTDTYVLMSNSKSGNYFIVQPGAVTTAVPATYGWGVCQYAGVAETNPTPNGYSSGAWAAWAN